MVNYSKINKKWWNSITPVHSRSKLYNLKDFKKGKSSLQEIEIQEIGSVKGKTMLHLMCHFGMDTLSFAKKGAIVTGVDISETAIALAKDLSSEIKTPATFICSDIYALPKILTQKFDIIFTSYGVLLWLSNIEKWATIIYHFLKKGGVFYIVDTHPFTTIFSHTLHMDYNYFEKDALLDDSSGTYADWKNPIKGKTYQWNHTVGDIVTALIHAGLSIEYLHEFPFTTYNQFPGHMKKNSKGQYVLRKSYMKLPLLFSLKAKK